MEIQSYFNKKKEFHNLFITFIEEEEIVNEDFQNLIDFINSNNIFKDTEEIMHFIRFLSQVSDNHYRHPSLFTKIELILDKFSEEIKKTLTSYDLFNIFINNKIILLFLIRKNIIQIEIIIYEILEKKEKNEMPFFGFFIPEIKSILGEEKMKKYENKYKITISDDYEEKRQKGVNDSYICSLIRDDLIDDFIIYTNKNNIPLNGVIKPSIFETNSFLNENEPTLIEYATFYGSIEIFQYLRLNNVELNSSLWLYVIHSNNPVIIHLLEENDVKPPQNTFMSCIEESIKCHRNDITNYIENNLLNQNITNIIENNLLNQVSNNQKIFELCIHYYDYSYIPDYYTIDGSVFFYLCYNNYTSIIKYLLKTIKIDDIIFFNKCNDALKIYFYLSKYKKITNKLFESNDRLNKIAIPLSINSIESFSFHNCTSLTNVLIHPFLISIGSNSFCNCTSLTEIKLPSTLTSIGESAFESCQSLKEISIPSSITSIKCKTFYNCISLKTVILPSNLKTIKNNAFTNCVSLTKIIFPSSLVVIKNDAFRGCESLKKIKIPNNVREISDNCFRNCLSLTKIKFERFSSLSTIGKNIFTECLSLSQVTLTPNLSQKIHFPNNPEIKMI